MRALERARHDKVAITIYVPAWTGPALPAVAGRLGTDGQQLAAELSRLVRGVSDSWAHATDLTTGCKLSIYLYEDVVGYGVAVSEERSMLLLPDGRGARPGSTTVTAHSVKRRGT